MATHRAIRKKPSSKVKIPIENFTPPTVSYPTSGLTVDHVVKNALCTAQALLTRVVRSKWNGEHRTEEDTRDGSILLTIELKHLCGHSIMVQRNMRRPFLKHGGRTASATLGRDMGRELAGAVKGHMRKCSLVECSKVVPETKIDGVQTDEVAAPKKVSKVKPKTECKICGKTDKKYPAWPECEHERKKRLSGKESVAIKPAAKRTRRPSKEV